MSKLSDRIIQVLIRKDVSIHAQLFRFMSLLGTIAMAVGGVYTLAEGMEIKNVAALFAGALFMGMLFWAGNKFQQYDLCSFILMSGLNGIFLPVTFLRSGGLKSGMPLWFVLGFISLFFLLRGKSLAAGTVITIIADAYCFYTAYVHPERITYMESESVVYGDIIVSAVITIFLTCAFMFIQITLSEYQRKENEKQQAELVAAMNTQSRFLANMSHEIRTPLNSIIGLSYLSRANLGDEKKVLENFDKIEMSAQFLRSCMDDILNLSLLESGRVAFHEESTDFEAFLTHIEKEFSDKAQEKKISFSVQRRGSFADQYLFDREKLNEALSAILENAVKYTQPEGSVFFIIELFTRGEQETIFRFEIRDNGIGMEQNFLPHIFDAFAQEDDRNTTLSGGTGLGLTISKNIIDFMGGKIDVYSEKGKGSAFVVTVPLKTAKEDRRRTERTTYQEYDFSGKRALLVEDNEINIEITRNILIHKNFMVDIAENGKAGVEQFLKHEPGYYDVILMDIRMPVMDGLAATRCIRESDHSDSKTVPIVAMTANVFEEDVKKSFDAGMNAHLSKPVDIKQMYAVLDELVTGDGLL